ncbi:type 4 pilus major pilin [Noviherbaspirillum pedocola]|uniref:Type 4 secretion system PilS N-terminal domain-containing protein n=1 Tax=Noviherbaspirillum pedocola TaxID=2801341 RepID=A0A934SVB2_9BURK|nr:type 4 pilus major pilin [Noviherbaspirillum pedocola]MBK4736085.1 hypothetical protein [Noviherbaspirillum pedocola]
MPNLTDNPCTHDKEHAMIHPLTRTRRRQAGYTLLELGFVMVIVGGMAYYAISGFLSDRDSGMVKNEIENTFKFISETMSQYSTQPDFSNVSTDVLRQFGVFPPSMVSGNQVHNLNHGTITAAPTTVTAQNDGVTFTETNYTQAMCQKVLPRIDAGVRLMTVNGIVVKGLDSQLKMDLLGANCRSDNNTVLFVISK